MRIAKRIGAMCLALLVLMMSGALADVPFLMHSNGWNLDGTPLDMALTADVDTHMPFDDDRLAMLTPLLDLMSLRLVTGDDEGLVTIGIAGQDALTLQYRGSSAQLSSMPGVTYNAETDPVSMLLGEDTSFPGLYEALALSPDGESLLTDGRVLLEKIPQAFEANGKKKQNTTNISGYGKAAYIIDYTFTAAQLKAMQESLLSICPDGWLHDIIRGLTFTGKQTVRMYFTAEDVLIRVEYNGSCGPKGAQRTVKLVWKLLHNDETDKDYIELTSPAKTGKDKNNLTFERTISTNKNGARTIVGSFKYTKTKDAITEIWNGEYNLSNAYTEDSDVLGGDFMIQTRLGGDDKYKTTIIAPALIFKGTEDDPDITGTISITEKYATRVTEHAVLSINLKRAEPLSWQATERVVDLSAMDEAALNSARGDAAASIATALVRPLILTLGAQNEYFFRDLPTDAVQAIIEAASPAANVPKEAE
jgi:hypothetical protein